MVSRRAPAVSSAPAVAEQEARVKQMEAELRAQNEARERDAAAAATEESMRQRRAGRAATILTGPQGVLTPNANAAPALKTVLG